MGEIDIGRTYALVIIVIHVYLVFYSVYLSVIYSLLGRYRCRKSQVVPPEMSLLLKDGTENNIKRDAKNVI